MTQVTKYNWCYLQCQFLIGRYNVDVIHVPVMNAREVSIPYRYGTTTEKSRLFTSIILKKHKFSTIFFKKVCHPPNTKIAVTLEFIEFLKNVKLWKEADRLFGPFLAKKGNIFNKKIPQILETYDFEGDRLF